MDADEYEGRDDIVPSIDDVLDRSTWRRKKRLHKQISNVSLVHRPIAKSYIDIIDLCQKGFYIWVYDFTPSFVCKKNLSTISGLPWSAPVRTYD